MSLTSKFATGKCIHAHASRVVSADLLYQTTAKGVPTVRIYDFRLMMEDLKRHRAWGIESDDRRRRADDRGQLSDFGFEIADFRWRNLDFGAI
jgi:hypothetical protein